MNDWSTVLLTAFLSSGTVAAILGFITSRRNSEINYGESVTKTLYTDYQRIKGELDEMRTENASLRKVIRELLDRVATLERDGRK